MDIEFIGKDILDCAYAIHSRLGSGLLGKAYRVILANIFLLLQSGMLFSDNQGNCVLCGH